MNHRSFLITYKSGKEKTVTGTIVFFSSINTEVPRPNAAIYLNADEVISVEEIRSEGKCEDGPNK